MRGFFFSGLAKSKNCTKIASAVLDFQTTFLVAKTLAKKVLRQNGHFACDVCHIDF